LLDNTSKKRVLGIILARGGSKSVPKKNIRPLGGIPLIAYTVVEALRSAKIGRLIVSTDDPEIQRIAIEYGAEAPFLRPADLSSDKATSNDAVKHALQWVEKEEGEVYDYIAELLCTNPMKTREDIDACIEKIIQTGADSVIGVAKLEDHHPIRIKKIVDDRIVDFCLKEAPGTRRQDLKPEQLEFHETGSIYVCTTKSLMATKNRLGGKIGFCETAKMESLEIDSAGDFELLQSVAKASPKKLVTPKKIVQRKSKK